MPTLLAGKPPMIRGCRCASCQTQDESDASLKAQANPSVIAAWAPADPGCPAAHASACTRSPSKISVVLECGCFDVAGARYYCAEHCGVVR